MGREEEGGERKREERGRGRREKEGGERKREEREKGRGEEMRRELCEEE